MTTDTRPLADLDKNALAAAVAAELGFSQRQARDVVTTVFDQIARTVSSGHAVTISNFGSWLPAQAAARPGRNPATGELMVVPARPTVRWRLSPRLRDHVRTGTVATIRKHPKGTLTGGDA